MGQYRKTKLHLTQYPAQKVFVKINNTYFFHKRENKGECTNKQYYQ